MSRHPDVTDAVDSVDELEHTAETVELRPGREHRNQRLDKYVAAQLPELSRTYLQQLIDAGRVLVDGQRRRAAFKVTPGEVVTVALPEPEAVALEPQAIPLDILYEDDDVLVLNKAAGMVVHPSPGHPRNTLVNAVLHHAPGIAIHGSMRPGIVHRLDKDTSGVMVVAKTERAQASLVRQWQTQEVEKRYTAVVAGRIEEDEATIDAPIARDVADRQRMSTSRTGRDAVTHLSVVERFADATLLDIEIETGRTHQIRVHLAFIGHPVLGDPVYGNRASARLAEGIGLRRQFLHARALTFRLVDGTRRTFEAPLPPDLEAALAALQREDHGGTP